MDLVRQHCLPRCLWAYATATLALCGCGTADKITITYDVGPGLSGDWAASVKGLSFPSAADPAGEMQEFRRHALDRYAPIIERRFCLHESKWDFRGTRAGSRSVDLEIEGRFQSFVAALSPFLDTRDSEWAIAYSGKSLQVVITPLKVDEDTPLVLCLRSAYEVGQHNGVEGKPDGTICWKWVSGTPIRFTLDMSRAFRGIGGSSGDTDRKNTSQDQPTRDDPASDAPTPENGD